MPRSLHRDGFLGSAVDFWRLPEFDSISLWVHDPPKAAVLQLLDLRVHRDALLPQRRHHGVQIFHAVVDHERGVVLSEVGRIRGEDRPDGMPDALPVFAAAPGEQGDHSFYGDAEMFAIPPGEGLWVPRLEEDAPDSRHATSARPRGHAREWASETKGVPFIDGRNRDSSGSARGLQVGEDSQVFPQVPRNQEVTADPLPPRQPHRLPLCRIAKQLDRPIGALLDAGDEVAMSTVLDLQPDSRDVEATIRSCTRGTFFFTRRYASMTPSGSFHGSKRPTWVMTGRSKSTSKRGKIVSSSSR